MEKLQTKLLEAATQNSIASLRKLLKNDQLLLERAFLNPFNETPLHVATMLGHLEFVEEIIGLKPELVNELNSHLSSPLHLAATKGHVGVVKALLSVDNRACLVRDKNELLPLHLAAVKGRVEAMKVLLEAQPDAAMVKIYGGESILHLCVKNCQLEGLRLIMERVMRSDEFINSRDDDGNTVLHLAVAEKQVEAIKFLVRIDRVEVNATNEDGITPLDVLIRSRRDVRDSQIEKSLKNIGGFATLENNHNPNNPQLQMKHEPSKKNSWKSLMKQHDDWFGKQKSALMVVASLIATIALQLGANPPGGVWNDDATKDSDGSPLRIPKEAGSSIYAYKYPDGYRSFYKANAIAFIASLSIILLLTSGLPMRRRFFMWILMATTWVAITATALCYVAVVVVLTPTTVDNPEGSVMNVMVVTIIVWILIMALLILGHTIRVVLKVVKMVRKAWRSRRRRTGPVSP